ncbi:hypothetical protein [Paucilactobacillus wasatchensis]|uniref:Uncharacterized protein n=1 Tax=Paucilactobacillus wasatchensis TaxID=1335616 RepID=A0A0D0Y6H8_9LACO|nr:hypothetical protein [Paucilactobacillus wasatchensis]KIS03883.1 hypothetical protein WDC_0530 [Paucilactobacillus wasatchensis]
MITETIKIFYPSPNTVASVTKYVAEYLKKYLPAGQQVVTESLRENGTNIEAVFSIYAPMEEIDLIINDLMDGGDFKTEMIK